MPAMGVKEALTEIAQRWRAVARHQTGDDLIDCYYSGGWECDWCWDTAICGPLQHGEHCPARIASEALVEMEREELVKWRRGQAPRFWESLK